MDIVFSVKYELIIKKIDRLKIPLFKDKCRKSDVTLYETSTLHETRSVAAYTDKDNVLTCTRELHLVEHRLRGRKEGWSKHAHYPTRKTKANSGLDYIEGIRWFDEQ
jgi:hypothetical protein